MYVLFFLTRLALGLKCLSCFIAFDSCSQRARFQPLGWEPSDRWTQVNGIDSLKWPVTCVKVSGWKQRWYQIFQHQKTQWILVTLLGFHDLFYFKSEWQAKTYRKISCLSIKNKRPFNLMEILAVCFLHHNTTGSKVKIPTSLQKAGSTGLRINQAWNRAMYLKVDLSPEKCWLKNNVPLKMIPLQVTCWSFGVVSFPQLNCWKGPMIDGNAYFVLKKKDSSRWFPFPFSVWYSDTFWRSQSLLPSHVNTALHGVAVAWLSHIATENTKTPCMVCLLPQGCSFESTSSCQ